jgi:hypothetical protein
LHIQSLAQRTDDSGFRSTIGADKKLAAGNLRKNLGEMQVTEHNFFPDPNEASPKAKTKLPKTNANDKIAKVGFRVGVASTEVMAGVQYINVEFGDFINKDVHLNVVSTSGIADGAGQAAVQGLASGAMTAPIGVVLPELMRTITNRLTKRSVLRPGRAQGAFKLLEESQDARSEALCAFKELVGQGDVISRAPRIAEKIVWYIGKLDRIEAEFKAYYAPLSKNLNFEKSSFATCDDAYKLVYNANYFFRNCEKFIAFLVYLEALLIQMDRTVTSTVGLPEGAIIKPGVKGWPRPVTVKKFGREPPPVPR